MNPRENYKVNIVDEICVVCGIEFEKYDHKITSGKNGIRPVQSVTCSDKCSKENQKLRNKHNLKLIPRVNNMILSNKLPKQSECMYKIGSVA